MFNKILITYSKRLTKNHTNTIDKVKDILKQNKIEYLSKDSHELTEEDFSDIDMVITIGGDGTFIRASHFLKQIPIIGINSEPEMSEGALTSLKESELNNLHNILKGKHEIIHRTRAKLKLNGKQIPYHALNEVYVGSDRHFHTSRYRIKFKDKKEEHRSSGVLISTGSGSTAWYSSAGGESFHFKEQELRFIIREPYFGNIYKPKILQGKISTQEKITIESLRYEGGIIALDSNLTYPFNTGDIVEIEISDIPLKVIKHNN
jgi:NAD+ kinase